MAKTKYMECTRNISTETHIIIQDMQFQKTKAFKYLGSILNEDNSFKQENQERIAARNRHTSQIK
jgi:hypothetical protein